MKQDIKIVSNCIDCKQLLPKRNKHHFRCHKCWESNNKLSGSIHNKTVSQRNKR